VAPGVHACIPAAVLIGGAGVRDGVVVALIRGISRGLG